MAGRADGVVLEDGSEIAARVVVSNADPKRTFLRLVPPQELDAEFADAVRAIKMDGPVRQAESRAGRGAAAEWRRSRRADALQRAQFTLVPWLDDAQRCYERARHGEIDARLWIDCLVPSLIDPSLVTPGRHVMTCFVQYLPYRVAGSDWRAERSRLQAQLLAQIAEFVPAVGRSLVASRLYTPADLEDVFGITEGNIFHGDLRPDQLFFMRPVPEHARYATPLRGLYLCGAGTHPGGGVTGAPGHNAAQRILDDLRRDRSLRTRCRRLDAESARRPVPVRYRILGVLFVLSFVNYFLRNNLSVAVPSIRQEFGFSSAELGWILGSFNLSYALLQIPGGLFGQWLGPRRALTIIAVSWGVLTFLTGFAPALMAASAAGAMVSLIVVRFLLGVANAPMYPIAAGAFANWFPAG